MTGGPAEKRWRALHFLAAPAHFQPAALKLVHLTLDILARAFGIFSCHEFGAFLNQDPGATAGVFGLEQVRGRTRGICSSPKLERR